MYGSARRKFNSHAFAPSTVVRARSRKPCTRLETKLTRHLEIEPTIDDGGYLEVLKSKLPDGSESALEIKAEVLEIPWGRGTVV